VRARRCRSVSTEWSADASWTPLQGPPATSLWCRQSFSILQMTPGDLADDVRHAWPVLPGSAPDGGEGTGIAADRFGRDRQPDRGSAARVGGVSTVVAWLGGSELLALYLVVRHASLTGN
jgi:hypothetical protein